MTRKDFKLIAQAMHDERPIGAVKGKREDDAIVAQFHICCTSLANALRTTNPRFDRAKFLAACGVES